MQRLSTGDQDQAVSFVPAASDVSTVNFRSPAGDLSLPSCSLLQHSARHLLHKRAEMQDTADITWSFVTADDLVRPERQNPTHSCPYSNPITAKQQTPASHPVAIESAL